MKLDYRYIVAGILFVGVLATLVRGTAAIFTDTAVVGANTFTTGTVDIATSPTSALVTYSTMAPGDKVTNPLTVSNNGSLQLRYAIVSQADNTDAKALRDVLTQTIKSGVTTCTNGGFATDGTQLFTGGVGTDTELALVGDKTQGSQAGDRTLNNGANEVLCFQVSLPSATGNAYQGATSTITYTFYAEQTSSNP